MGIATIQELVRVSSLLASDQSRASLISTLVEQAQDISKSELGALYAYPADAASKSPLKMIFKRGKYNVPLSLDPKSDLVNFIEDCREVTVVHSKEDKYFTEGLLSSNMNSAIILPLTALKKKIGILILNSKKNDFYGKNRLHFLDAFTKLSAGLVHNAELLIEIKQRLKEIESLQRYQDSIFSSMTNLLITTDEKGIIQYLNSAAEERLQEGNLVGKNIESCFKKALSRKVLNQIKKAKKLTGKY